MNTRHILSALLAAFCFLAPVEHASAAQAPAEQVQLAPEVQALRARAVQAFNAGDYETAYPLLMKLLRETPEDAEVSVALGKTCFATQRWTQAIMAYERLSMRWPSDVRWRIALAQVYSAMGESESAQRELDAARIIEPTVSDAVLGRAAAVDSRFSVHGRLTAGLGWDSNVNGGPDALSFTVGPWHVRMHDGDAENSWGAFVSGRVEAGWRVDENSPWHVVGDVGFHKRFNFEDVYSGREFGWGRAGIGVRHIGHKTLFDVRLKGEASDQSRCNGSTGWGPEASFMWAVHPRVHLITAASLELRSYEHDDGRDGDYWWIGQYVRTFFGEKNHEVTAGLRWMEGDADRNFQSWSGWEASLSGRVKLPYDLELRPYLAYRMVEWDGPATFLEKCDREDDQFRWGLSLVWNYDEHLQFETGWTSIRNDSESPFCEYDRDMFNVSATWRF